MSRRGKLWQWVSRVYWLSFTAFTALNLVHFVFDINFRQHPHFSQLYGFCCGLVLLLSLFWGITYFLWTGWYPFCSLLPKSRERVARRKLEIEQEGGSGEDFLTS